MEWRAYFAIDGEEFSYMTITGMSSEEAREKAICFERAIEGYTEAPVKFLDVFGVVSAADIHATPRLPR